MNKWSRYFAVRPAVTAVLAALLVIAALPVMAGEVVYTKRGKAINGYDPVAYFTQGQPTKGKTDFTHNWMGSSWRFASAANRDAFAAEPEKFAPQYGGYCAWAVSQGYTASTDPNAWKIVGGKLYLNYSKGIQQRWASSAAKLIVDGDQNWPGIKAKLAN